jgi:surface carbohydrate biosynthesis protein
VPVENQGRELDGKILLACAAAEHGFPVVLGSRNFLHFAVDSLPRGVYVAKSMRTLSIKMFEILRELGHEIVAWDEEAHIRMSDELFYTRRLSPRTMCHIAHLFAWGPDDARAYRQYPGYNGCPIHVTGNPRGDMTRAELRAYHRPAVDRIHERFGELVLVNTNFGTVNHFLTVMNEEQQLAKARQEESASAFARGRTRYKRAMFNHFLQMLPALAEALPGHTVVVRPHPTEDHAPWLDVASRSSNIRVANDGSVLPWLIAARVLISNGCTTALEAAMLDRPAITYQPFVDPEYDDDMPNSLGHRVYSTDALCEAAVAAVNGRLAPLPLPTRRAVIDQHIAAMDGPLSVDRIVDALVEGGYLDHEPPPVSRARHLRGVLRNRWRTAKKKSNWDKPDHRAGRDFHDHRFPEISEQQMRGLLGSFRATLGRFDNVRVERIDKHLFRFDRAPGADPRSVR